MLPLGYPFPTGDLNFPSLPVFGLVGNQTHQPVSTSGLLVLYTHNGFQESTTQIIIYSVMVNPV